MLCRCYTDVLTRALVADCSNLDLVEIPQNLPNYTDWLIVSENNISSLNQEILETSYFPYITKLDISGNSLENISNLFEVYTCSISRLSLLDISNNHLTTLPRNIINISSLSNLWLDRNSFKCICDNFWMKGWLNNSGIVENYTNITCTMSMGDAKEIRIIDMDPQEVGCPLPESTVLPANIWKPIGLNSFLCFIVKFYFYIPFDINCRTEDANFYNIIHYSHSSHCGYRNSHSQCSDCHNPRQVANHQVLDVRPVWTQVQGQR